MHLSPVLVFLLLNKFRLISVCLVLFELTSFDQSVSALAKPQPASDRVAGIAAIEKLRTTRSYFAAGAKLDQLQAKYPDAPDVIMSAARLHRDMGLFARAEVDYLKVLQRQPDLPEACVALSNIYLEKLDMPKTLNYARRAFNSNPTSETRLGLSSALLAAGKFGEAQRQLDTLLKTDAKNPQVQYSAYEMAQSLNENALAQKHLESAVNLAPGRADWLIELASLYKESGDYLYARKTLERALVEDPNSQDGLSKLAVIYEFYLHDYDSAMDVYHRILSLDSESVSALAGLDRCKVKKNDISGALKYQMQSMFSSLFSLFNKNQTE